MAIFCKVYQDTREDHQEHLFYGRAVHFSTVNTKKLAQIIQANCSMKYSDVIAVIAELVEVMTQQLQNSNTVKLDGFGTFKAALTTRGAETEKDFDVNNNVRGIRILFQPEKRKIAGTSKYTKQFVDGAEVRKYSV